MLIVQRDKSFAYTATTQNFLSYCTINILLKFILLYFNNFILPRPRNLYVILVRRTELPEDDILNVETCSRMLLVITVFDIIVQSLVKLLKIYICCVFVGLDNKI